MTHKGFRRPAAFTAGWAIFLGICNPLVPFTGVTLWRALAYGAAVTVALIAIMPAEDV